MAISARDRKLLWGRSGNRCAMCQRELIMAGTPAADDSIIGDECHIVSGAPSGPRHDPTFPHGGQDDYSNLLLLCKVHHKLIDDQEEKFPASSLVELKARHEEWVSNRLDASGFPDSAGEAGKDPRPAPAFLSRIRSGRELLAIVTSACAYATYYDDLRTEAEEDLVAGFLQDAQDWGELDLDSERDRMRAARSLDEHLRDLEDAGLWVFGGRELQIAEGKTGPYDWPVAHVRVLRSSNPEIRLVRPDPRHEDAGSADERCRGG